MTIRVCLAGISGWAGSTLAKGINQTDDIEVVAGVSRQQAGRSLSEVLDLANIKGIISASAEEALAIPCDVFVEYTKPDVAKSNVLAALRHGAHVVIGTSGLTDADYAEINEAALQQGKGVLAVGNFSMAVVLLQKCAELVAKYIPQYEIIDYASAGKKDSPSGTVRELAYRLSQIQPPQNIVPIDQTQGPLESRGVTLNGVQVHSLRLPGHVISAEVLFGDLDQRLSIRYDAGISAEAYVEGALLAIRKVGTFVGLKRGLDSVMEF
ncbi:MAG: 4-hydroxy-tetrahydrodipicolinate reductase [Anaerolineaceae bacterium]|nr:4-hydroxy-tetrahydrodipicolinate reductase [Anaerolineaceae bacterium]